MYTVEKPRFILLGAALVFAAAMAIYMPSISRELLWDDGAFIGRNPFARNCSNLGTALNPLNLFKVLPVPMGARPVVNATLIADACAGGGPAGMHLTNSLIHAFNAVLVFLLIFSLSGAGTAAFFGALVFALHPAAAEVVNIITFRSHLLGFFFFTAGLLAAVFHSREGRPGPAMAASVCYLLAMLSVETAIVLPAAAFMVIYFEKGREGVKKVLPFITVLAALAVFYLWFRTPRSGYVIPGIASQGVSGPSLLYPKFLFPAATRETTHAVTLLPWRLMYHDPLARLYTMARVTLDYFAALVLPIHLNSDYSPAVITSASAGLWPLAADLAAAAAAIALFIRKRLAGLGLALVLIALLPALNIWPVYNIKADRYLYLPLAGFSLAAAAVFARISRPDPALLPTALKNIRQKGGGMRLYRMGAAWLWLAALVFLNIARIPEFKDNLSFFSTAVKKDPTVSRARINLAAMYMRSGNCPAAINQTVEAARLDPQNYQLELRLNFTLAYCDRRTEALKKTDALLEKRPQEADALYLAGVLRLKSDRRSAISFLQKALKSNPSHREARLTLILAENGTIAGLPSAERNNLKKLEKLYGQIGLR
ncbi:MAG: hypothetical protein A2X34_03225 [Elusimicrobia bacterium GWC2_51_8]|nr:MAG: hypothetical protein A2X33_06110 [Elusimicrobia bacterium GWA2_51_34]OGR61978.1 MAG: hypothetical protein A2X34_03225 [Elusimicrobia bacterium GWC2_51_8]OGR85203.1 MAG: hypothetical protein A2021_00475 [Elusimicrobia bacterium GWF2_52_66]HAF94757.1 hypothetical protein [Elusimicrobiota bacterium]HCE97633.1 hypothetical protein [Elusimicrobiota bacterium]